MRFHIVTLFPEVVDAYTGASILGRAQREGKMEVKTYQLRDFVTNKWGKADERPYGGGPGMVLQAEPFLRAVETIEKITSKVKKSGLIYQSTSKNNSKPRVLITSAGGKPLTNAMAKKLAKEKDVIILCGRYEGIDARVKRILKAEEVSVGSYILTGGEVPAMAIIDATARQIPGVLGKIESLEEGRVASHDVYTRPEVLKHKGKNYRVPKVLLSGHHANINAQRSKKRSNPNRLLINSLETFDC
jgi:tRNA (guanine37-N1)-methyltransferase